MARQAATSADSSMRILACYVDAGGPAGGLSAYKGRPRPAEPPKSPAPAPKDAPKPPEGSPKPPEPPKSDK